MFTHMSLQSGNKHYNQLKYMEQCMDKKEIMITIRDTCWKRM